LGTQAAGCQVRLDRALSSLIQLKMSLLIAGGLDQVASKGPLEPKPFCDSMPERRLAGNACRYYKSKQHKVEPPVRALK